MIETGLILFALAFMVAISTLGTVLLVSFMLGSKDTATRTLAAAFLGPGLVLLPIGALVFLDQGAIAEGVLGILIIMVLLFAIIGYPVSHFATRRLDKLTRFDPDIFE